MTVLSSRPSVRPARAPRGIFARLASARLAFVGLALAGGTLTWAGCAKPTLVGGAATGSATGSTDGTVSSTADQPASGKVPLVVRNRSYFDISVYAHRAANSPGRRIGTISSGSEQTFTVNDADLQAGRQLMLGVRAIAGRSAWVSQSLSVGNNVVARLDVLSDPNGDLGRTVLYLENAR